MPDDGITSYGMGITPLPAQSEIRAKEAKRLRHRAQRLLRKAEIAEFRGNKDRQIELSTQANSCLSKAQQLF